MVDTVRVDHREAIQSHSMRVIQSQPLETNTTKAFKIRDHVLHLPIDEQAHVRQHPTLEDDAERCVVFDGSLVFATEYACSF
jgi:hypothetical protein